MRTHRYVVLFEDMTWDYVWVDVPDKADPENPVPYLGSAYTLLRPHDSVGYFLDMMDDEEGKSQREGVDDTATPPPSKGVNNGDTPPPSEDGQDEGDSPPLRVPTKATCVECGRVFDLS